MTLPYNTGFPTTNDSLGTTRNKFFANTASIKTFLDVNHYDFGNTLYGNHKWVLYGRQTGTFPDTTTPSALAIATYGSSDGTRTQLWYQPSNDATGAKAIQLTAGDVTAATFSTNTVYATDLNGGWTFLPGKMLLQYGYFDPNTIIAITFPINFSAAPYSIQLTGEAGNSTAFRANIRLGTLTASGFTFEGSINSNFTPVFWTAIGKA
jgi:hypothetical protein